MNKSNFIEDFNEIFRQYFDDINLEITESTCAHDIEEWDSLAQVGLIILIERKYKFKFSISELEGLQNVGEMADLCLRKVNAAKSS